MDAKSKANFINSVASGQMNPCPVCGVNNSPDRKYCSACGGKLNNNTTPAFENIVEESVDNNKAVEVHKELTKFIYKEPDSVFADGLPSWDIVPPQVMVRRR